MATVGNNGLGEKAVHAAHVRDTYASEDQYHGLINDIKENGNPVAGLKNLNETARKYIREQLIKRIPSLSYDKQLRTSLLYLLFTKQFDKDNIDTLFFVNNDAKIALFEILNECVEFGLVSHEEMSLLSSVSALMLNSIEDLQMVNIRERLNTADNIPEM